QERRIEERRPEGRREDVRAVEQERERQRHAHGHRDRADQELPAVFEDLPENRVGPQGRVVPQPDERGVRHRRARPVQAAFQGREDRVVGERRQEDERGEKEQEGLDPPAPSPAAERHARAYWYLARIAVALRCAWSSAACGVRRPVCAAWIAVTSSRPISSTSWIVICSPATRSCRVAVSAWGTCFR